MCRVKSGLFKDRMESVCGLNCWCLTEMHTVTYTMKKAYCVPRIGNNSTSIQFFTTGWTYSGLVRIMLINRDLKIS